MIGDPSQGAHPGSPPLNRCSRGPGLSACNDAAFLLGYQILPGVSERQRGLASQTRTRQTGGTPYPAPQSSHHKSSVPIIQPNPPPHSGLSSCVRRIGFTSFLVSSLDTASPDRGVGRNVTNHPFSTEGWCITLVRPMSSSGTRVPVWLRYLCSTPGWGLGGVDAVWPATRVGEGSVFS